MSTRGGKVGGLWTRLAKGKKRWGGVGGTTGFQSPPSFHSLIFARCAGPFCFFNRLNFFFFLVTFVIGSWGNLYVDQHGMFMAAPKSALAVFYTFPNRHDNPTKFLVPPGFPVDVLSFFGPLEALLRSFLLSHAVSQVPFSQRTPPGFFFLPFRIFPSVQSFMLFLTRTGGNTDYLGRPAFVSGDFFFVSSGSFLSSSSLFFLSPPAHYRGLRLLAEPLLFFSSFPLPPAFFSRPILDPQSYWLSGPGWTSAAGVNSARFAFRFCSFGLVGSGRSFPLSRAPFKVAVTPPPCRWPSVVFFRAQVEVQQLSAFFSIVWVVTQAPRFFFASFFLAYLFSLTSFRTLYFSPFLFDDF